MADGEFKPVTAIDVAEDNPAMIRGELRSIARDFNARFDRLETRLDVVIRRVLDGLDDVRHEVRTHGHELRSHATRITALEKKTKKTVTKRRRVRRKKAG